MDASSPLEKEEEEEEVGACLRISDSGRETSGGWRRCPGRRGNCSTQRDFLDADEKGAVELSLRMADHNLQADRTRLSGEVGRGGRETGDGGKSKNGRRCTVFLLLLRSARTLQRSAKVYPSGRPTGQRPTKRFRENECTSIKRNDQRISLCEAVGTFGDGVSACVCVFCFIPSPISESRICLAMAVDPGEVLPAVGGH